MTIPINVIYEGPYKALFNSHPCSLSYDNKWWKTAEHAMQAAKYKNRDPAYADIIRRTQSLQDAIILGDRGRHQRPNWNLEYLDTMHDIVLAKFMQNESCRIVLSNTGRADINMPAPHIKLGKVLMCVREQLKDMPYNQLLLV